MVGQKTKKSVNDFFSTIEGLQYSLGQIDCFSLVVKYLEYTGNPIKETENFRGLTLHNYSERYIDDEAVIDVAGEYFTQKLKQIETHRSFIGDILMLDHGGTRFFGIDAGNGSVLTVNMQSGVGMTKKSIYEILRAWAIQ